LDSGPEDLSRAIREANERVGEDSLLVGDQTLWDLLKEGKFGGGVKGGVTRGGFSEGRADLAGKKKNCRYKF